MKSRIVNVGNTESPSSQNSKHVAVVYPVVERQGFDCVMRVREVDTWQPDNDSSIQESDENESVGKIIAEIMKNGCSHARLKDEMRWGRFVDADMERMYRDYFAAKNWHSLIRLLFISALYHILHSLIIYALRLPSYPWMIGIMMTMFALSVGLSWRLHIRQKSGGLFFSTVNTAYIFLSASQLAIHATSETLRPTIVLFYIVVSSTNITRGDAMISATVTILSSLLMTVIAMYRTDGFFLFLMLLPFYASIFLALIQFYQLENVDRRAFMKIILMNQADQTARTEKSKSMKLLYNLFPRPLADKEVAGSSLGQDEITRTHGTVICIEYGIHSEQITKTHSRKHSESRVMLIELIREIGDRLQIHLISTKGRKFILASGMFENEIEHQQNAHEFAGLLIESMRSYLNSKGKPKEGESQEKIRIGISSGSLSHGILNFNKRRAYDIFGASVNESEVQCQKAQWWRIESKQKRQSRPKLLNSKKFSVPDILRASQTRSGRDWHQQVDLKDESKGKVEENQKKELDITVWLQGKTLLQPYRHKFFKIFPYFQFDEVLESAYTRDTSSTKVLRQTSAVLFSTAVGFLLATTSTLFMYGTLSRALESTLEIMVFNQTMILCPILVLTGICSWMQNLSISYTVLDYRTFILHSGITALYFTSCTAKHVYQRSLLTHDYGIRTYVIDWILYSELQMSMMSLFSNWMVNSSLKVKLYASYGVFDILSYFAFGEQYGLESPMTKVNLIILMIIVPITLMCNGMYVREQINREEYILSRKLEKDIKSANEQSEIAQAITISIIPHGLYMAMQTNSEKILQNLDGALVIAIAFSKPKNLILAKSSTAFQDIVAFISECFEFASRVASDYNLSITKTSGNTCLIVVPTSSEKSKSIHSALRFCLQLESLSCGKENHPEIKAKFVAQICASIGDMVVGIVGKSTFRYDVLGTPVDDVFENVVQGNFHRVQICDSLVTLVETDCEFRLVHEICDSETHGDEGIGSPRLYLEGVSDIWGMFCKYVDWGDNSLHKE